MPAVHTIPKTLQTWGCTEEFDKLTHLSGPELQAKYNMWAFANYFRTSGFAPRRYHLFQMIADYLVPGWFEWHEWTERLIDALCRRRWVAIGGCSNSAKTRNFAGYGCIYWLCAPGETSFVMCSTTMKMLRKRGWSEIHAFYEAFTQRWGEFGNMVDSRTMWQYRQGDDKHAIFGLAVQDGDTNKAAANIQGLHTKRQLVGLDEAEEIAPAIWTAAANLWSYPVDAGGEFTLGAAANPRSRLSRFGRFIEPLGGWDSVSVETEEWESKPQLDGKKALVVRLDFLKSPNVKADRPVSKHLPTKIRVKNRMDALKARGAENDPDHWCFDRGFPAPEGLTKGVFSESLFTMHRGYDLHQFNGQDFTIIGAFDQAFGGGDRPALRFGALGAIGSNKMGIEWMPPIELSIDSTRLMERPVRYQLMDLLQKHCGAVQYRGEVYRCDKRNLAIDCTGEGGLADICDQSENWDKGQQIIRIQFSGECSEEPMSHEDPRPANKVCRNKRAEMYLQTKNALTAGQLRGVDKDTAAELCTIEFFEYNDKGIKIPITIQSKKEYKLKYTKSPDYADCGIMLTEVARLRNFRIVETGHTVERTVETAKVVQQAQAVYDEIDYGAQDGSDEPDYADAFLP